MLCRRLQLVNRLGLHARSTAQFVQRAGWFESAICLIGDRKDSGGSLSQEEVEAVAAGYLLGQTDAHMTQDVRVCDAKSITEIMVTMRHEYGEYFIICAEGKDEAHAIEALASLVNERFGEE